MNLSVAIVGLGRAGMNHLYACKDIAEIGTIVLCDRDEEKVKKLGAEFGIRTYTNYDDMYKNEKLDVTIISVPPRFHGEVCKVAVANGQHILMEKPLAMSLEESEELLELVQGYNKKVMVNENYRWAPDAERVTDAIKKGLLGEIYWMKVELLRMVEEDPTESKWLAKEKLRFLLEDGVHWVDLFNYWLDVQPKKVFAHFPYLPHGEEKDEGDKFNVVHVVYEQGKGATLIEHFVSRGFKPTHQGGRSIFRIRVEGSLGAAVIDWGDRVPMKTSDVEVSIYSHALDSVLLPYSQKGADYWPVLNQGAIEHLVRCIEKDEDPLVDFAEEVKALKIVFAAYESADTGEVVDID